MPALTIILKQKTIWKIWKSRKCRKCVMWIAGHGCLVKIIIIDYYPTCLAPLDNVRPNWIIWSQAINRNYHNCSRTWFILYFNFNMGLVPGTYIVDFQSKVSKLQRKVWMSNSTSDQMVANSGHEATWKSDNWCFFKKKKKEKLQDLS